MRIALIGDIHANLPALEAVLADARAAGCAATWNIGDFVGYGPYPDEVVKRVMQENIPSVIGNYDRKTLRYLVKGVKTRNPLKRQAFEWALRRLSSESRAYLETLPRQQRLQVEDWSVLLCHASPESIKEHLGPDTPDERLRELAALAETQIVVFGHSHIPFARQVDETWFINTGSVGRPDDGDPRACYALLELAPGRLTVEHRRIQYDVERSVRAIYDAGLPDAFAEMLRVGRNLDWVIDR